MSLAYKALALVTAVLVGLLAAFFLGYHMGSSRNAQVALKTVQATSVSREVQKARLRRSEALAGHALDSALAKVPTWADQPVPKEVQDDLCQVLDCLPRAASDSLREPQGNP